MDFCKTQIKINTSCEKWVSDTIPATSFGSKKKPSSQFWGRPLSIFLGPPFQVENLTHPETMEIRGAKLKSQTPKVWALLVGNRGSHVSNLKRST